MLVSCLREEGGRMYWYNPKTRCTETIHAPETDEEALALLEDDLNTMAFVAEYEKLREKGMGIEQALIFTGHEFRLKQLEFRAAR